MVRHNTNKKERQKQFKKEDKLRIGPNTPYGTCSERLTGFGGLFLLIKLVDLLGMQEVFERHYVSPRRQPKLGCYQMIYGLMILLFVGFQRVGHIEYIREDAMICGLFKVKRLPAVSTYWRYVQSLGIIQSQSLLRVMAELRRRTWQFIKYQPKRVSINMDTTVATVYGQVEGAQKGHNPKHRGKKGLRPVLCFVHETREYLCGNQRRGQTISRKEVAKLIQSFRSYLPECVEQVLVRGDHEFVGWLSVQACLKNGYEFIFANSWCALPLDEKNWYAWGQAEYNECFYQPKGWKQACRFVVVRTLKKTHEEFLLEGEKYIYRAFVTNLRERPHQVMAEYDKRADVENQIGEAQREGILAVASKRFQSHHVYFQLVMLAYNLWRWLKLLAESQQSGGVEEPDRKTPPQGQSTQQTLRLSRLKMLYVAAKVTSHSNRKHIYYSIHDSRIAGIINFLKYLDHHRMEYATPPLGQPLANGP